MKALVLNNFVVQVEQESFEVAPPLRWAECSDDTKVGFMFDGMNFREIQRPEKSQSMIEAEYEMVLKGHLNDVARERKYSDATSCISYINSTNAAWAAEAQAFNKYRDDIYSFVIELQSDVASGAKKMPEMGDFSKMLPVMVWPS